MSAALFWVRHRDMHTAAHIIAAWSSRRPVFRCGNTADPGGRAISRAEAQRLQVHVCVGCARLIATDKQKGEADVVGR